MDKATAAMASGVPIRRRKRHRLLLWVPLGLLVFVLLAVGLAALTYNVGWWATLVVLGAVYGIVRPKTRAKMKGRNRCGSCGSRLKYVGGAYKATCPKCGQRQSWAA